MATVRAQCFLSLLGVWLEGSREEATLWPTALDLPPPAPGAWSPEQESHPASLSDPREH